MANSSADLAREKEEATVPELSYVAQPSGNTAQVTVVEGVPVEAVPADHAQVALPVVATPAMAAPHPPREDPIPEQTKRVGSMVGAALTLLGLILFIIGCRTMDYLGFGAGAWYAGLFQMITGILFVSLKFEACKGACHPRGFLVAGLVLSVITILITVFGFFADFVWMGYAKSHDVCAKRLEAKIQVWRLSPRRIQDIVTCDEKCIAVDYDWDDNKGDVFCYDHNWGSCDDFCDGEFPKLAATCGSFGLVAFFLVFGLSVLGCTSLCCVRRV